MRRLAILTAALLAACQPDKGTQVKATGDTFADSADQVFYKVNGPIESNGIRRGTLHADTMYVMNDQSRFDLLNGKIDFNTELGVPDGSMRADRGRFDRRSNTLEGWGNVVVKSADGRTLRSPHVIYSQAQDRIWSDTTYEFTAEKTVSTGKGFETDLKMTRKICKSDCQVRTLVNIPK
jgi:LPS export ABC transporter protein LptC